ncbi:MAG TPA: RluA family pseudouridine synthase [bacterium]|nr:RluA family pseudouridine synthase [bacterium]
MSASPRPSFSVLYEDDHFIAVDKPAGMIVVEDRWDKGKQTLRGAVQAALGTGKVWTVHRIDKDTTGVVLFAKDAEAHRYANGLFMERRVTKEYEAVVRGVIACDSGVIDEPIKEDLFQPGRVIIHRTGKPSVTSFTVLERFRSFTYICACPQSGRMHQIRAHMTSYGHPLAVDPLYGGGSMIRLSELKKDYKRKKGGPEKPLIERLTLHAARLSFTGMDGREIAISSELPHDMALLLKYLRKGSQ